MKLFGLTGGIGMGKSTGAKVLVELGIDVVDTDIIARDIVQPGCLALEELKTRFGKEIVGGDGHLRRDELARRVFADPEARRDLESILHPRIREVWLRQVAQWRTEGKSTGVVVIPLLFETGVEEHFDAAICFACGAAAQYERLVQRGWSRQQIGQRIDAQWSIERKMALADYVVWTEGEVAVHRLQLERIFRIS